MFSDVHFFRTAFMGIYFKQHYLDQVYNIKGMYLFRMMK